MEKLVDIAKDFSGWYLDILEKTEMIDYSPVKGCFVLRPYSYSLWENIKIVLDKRIKETGTQNAYFPLFIPENFFKKEAKHVEGFSPELAIVTYAGGKRLEEPLVVRPTSETIIYYMFAKWIKSWRDLPLKINQWANIVRWELRTRPFLRTREILWQEGHTAHNEKQEAIIFAQRILDMYRNFMEEYLAIPVVTGMKSESEKFVGAENTYCLEALMQDGKALQMGTTHVLLHNFSKSFDINYQDKDGNLQSPYCTSWGLTTRLIGAIIMVHGDEKGLIMPPKIAPIKAVIIPIYKNEKEKEIVLNKVEKLYQQLYKDDFNIIIDSDKQLTPGAKFYKWELKGVPVRIEVGPKDIEKDQVVLISRLVLDGIEKKSFVKFSNIENELKLLLDKIQNGLFEKAKKRLMGNWYQTDSLNQFGPIMEKENGFYQAGWCGSEDCEKKLKDYKGTIRTLLDENKHDTCFYCGKSSKNDVLIAKAY